MDKSTKKRATITQVAKHAGVSVGTVSNYLNGTAGVSHDRAARIQQAIDVLDYIPDTLASSLRRKDSTAIHVLTPHLDSAFYTNTISALMHDAYEAGYTVHISGYEYSSEIERQQLRALESSKPGTSIIIFNGFDDLTEIKRLAKKQIHVIMADRREIPGYTSSVIFDNRRVPFEIICLLKNRNYKRIGLFTEPTKLQNIRERVEGFLEAMKYKLGARLRRPPPRERGQRASSASAQQARAEQPPAVSAMTGKGRRRMRTGPLGRPVTARTAAPMTWQKPPMV